MPWRSLRRCSDRAKAYIRSQLNRLRRVGTILRAWPPARTRTSDRTGADAVDDNSSIRGAGCTAIRQPSTTATGSTAGTRARTSGPGTTGSSPAPWGRCRPPVLPVRPPRRSPRFCGEIVFLGTSPEFEAASRVGSSPVLLGGHHLEGGTLPTLPRSPTATPNCWPSDGPTGTPCSGGFSGCAGLHPLSVWLSSSVAPPAPGSPWPR